MLDGKRTLTIFSFILIFCLLVYYIYQGCRQLSIEEAENSLAGFLLNHKAVHSYVAEVQRPELYRLQRDNILSPTYFSPVLFSRTYIARQIKDALNREREKAGMDAVSFKLVARNPRNPINTGNDFELELLDRFGNGELSDYRDILSTKDGRVLYYAIPVAPNTASCLRCHGEPGDAPPEILRQYGEKTGFFEKEGDIRALISVKVPLEGLLDRAFRTTLMLSSIAFGLFTAFLVIVFLVFRKMDRQEKRSEATTYYLDSILQSSRDTAIIVTDSNDVVVYFNQAAELLLGTEANAIQGKSLLRIHSLFSRQPLGRFASKLENIKKVGSYRFSVNRDGHVLDVRIASITGKEGEYRGLLFIGHDIAEQVAARKEQEEMQVKLQKAEKMESIGLMASGVAHDLNNILAGITSYPELMLLNLEKDSPLRRPLKAIEEAGLRAAAVVDDLLTVARGAAIVKEVVSLNELVDEYMASPEHLKLAAGYPDISWEVTFERKLKNVSCAPVHFKKCIMNLLRNGVEAMHGKGTISITTHSRVVDEAIAASIGVIAGEYSVVSFADDGPGVGPDDLHHVFEPFYTKKKMGVSGTGLGLSVVWNTMQDHDGTVTVYSRESGGARFDLYFPVSSESVSTMADVESVDSLQGDNQLILVVDDEERLRDIATQKLIALGYQVESVTSGEEAVEYLRDNEVDLVLLDMVMDPGISGYETYKRIIAFRPGQKALIVSGYSTGREVEKATRLGVSGFLKKPYTLVQLGLAIRQAISRPTELRR